VLSNIDFVMEELLPTAPYIVRSAWILASFADPNHDKFYNDSIIEYRRGQRNLYLQQLQLWNDSPNSFICSLSCPDRRGARMNKVSRDLTY